MAGGTARIAGKFVNRLLIVDGHAYAYRAFYAIRNLRSPDGQPTNAIFGFVKMLEKMRAGLAPTHLIVVWDGGLSTERVAALPEYKAQRPAMPDELRPQLDGIVSYLQAAGVATFQRDEVEADDYIACLSRQAVQSGMSVVIASADKDFMQLVSPQVGLLNPNDKSETIWTDEQVRVKTGPLGGKLRDLRGQAEVAYTQQDAKDLIDRNSAEDNAAYLRLAERLIQQQDAAVNSPASIRASVPSQGRLLTFKRAVVVNDWENLAVDLRARAERAAPWGVRAGIIAATLALLVLFMFAAKLFAIRKAAS